MKIITTEEFAKATKLDTLKMPGLAAMLMELMKINQVNDLFAQAQPKQGPDFVDAILKGCGIEIEFDERELRHIPKDGAFIAIANHPYGGIEGLILLKILTMVRPDAKLMANFLLKKIPNLSDYFIAVNPFENVEHSSSISGLKNTLELLNNGTPIGIFPAGEVSTFKLDKREVTDRLWHPVVGKIIAKAKVPVVPIYFHGNNGLLFNLLSMIHPALRTAKLPSELFNKQGQTIKLRIGKPIKVENIPDNRNSASILNFLRAKTYALGAGLDEEKKLFNPRNLFKIKSLPEAIVPETSAIKLEKEIDGLRENYKVWTEKNYEVYITPTSQIPTVIREIGRLREITFREVGEGTNKATDLDEYDIYYHHLFIWDTEGRMIVGAYRLGLGDEIFYGVGKKGFYINELFKIKEQFTPVLKKSLELGRSWIRKEYQLKPLPLFLLWKGILKFVIDNPRYRYLIGPVSISNSFSQFSKSLIVDYINRNHFDHELAQYVKPRKKFKVNFENIDTDLLMSAGDTFKGLDNLISEVEAHNMKVPVLLRQYLTLNAHIISFNIDPKFADCLDGFLVLDLEQVPQDMLEKLGKNL
ncbi:MULTISPECIES: lysophospholipid acyltransferase family protein [unclassified Mucilaginibacter]|uniref:lysophospholipid acyltransferase family protein n=1 Tax=unclassified Mucilaginibacter TaxID=2617802 RepID=UPI002AC8A4EA|nr:MULTISPECIES: lysophospholipid acyltransferase family protein [unclassified Mucilaginibacter]MEB0262416.1 lysophospholipid acyltransferase family protein [Mucilaginibacter sp. 10I4]MEB0277927.1 lysophospholipid acyltransferase family protein [Mucilaginibacter sp. 10B2]MEB0299720.1 lysophospholipid acyltransferase family protein [Mucilaginibacter sp. 5C4]WPX22818.1 lysophospholipid acyltransferase family protein [Mucilaginibacter sp. 5C4]